MRYLTTAALALVLAAGALGAQAQPSGNDNKDKGNPTHASGGHAGGQGGSQGGNHTGGQGGSQGGGHTGGAGGASGSHTSGVTGGSTGGSQTGGSQTGGSAGGTHHRTVTGGAQTGGQGGTGGSQGGHTFTAQGIGQTGGRPGGNGGGVSGQVGGTRGANQVGGASGGSHGFQFRQHSLRGRDQGRSYYHTGSFAQHVVASARFHGHFGRPGGWYYRSWGYGQFLPFGWFGPSYYLDWTQYDLPVPPIGCEWIAEGPDAVLVDVWTGEVLSVYSGVFY